MLTVQVYVVVKTEVFYLTMLSTAKTVQHQW